MLVHFIVMIVLKIKCQIAQKFNWKMYLENFIGKRKWQKLFFLSHPPSAFRPNSSPAPPSLPGPRPSQPANAFSPYTSLSAADGWGPSVRSFLFLRQPPMRFGRAPAPHLLPLAPRLVFF